MRNKNTPAIYFLKNQILDYSWGSKTALSKLLNQKSPAQGPQAELWMGTHPKAPSKVFYQNRWIPLDELIQRKPALFKNNLPYLFKVLAVQKPLSLQAHPNQHQAKRGYRKESRFKIPLQSPRRSYKDSQEKAEILCALTPFEVLCGFRKASDIVKLLSKLNATELSPFIEVLKKDSSASGLRRFFKKMLTLGEKPQRTLCKILAQKAQKHSNDPLYRCVTRLERLFPGDLGILSPLLLNWIHLKPGQAIFIPPRMLHSYLSGCGIELMGNSDNVLRGGLTKKPMDRKGLLDLLSFEEKKMRVLNPIKLSGAEKSYPLPPSVPFHLSKLQVQKGTPFKSRTDHGNEILICLKGSGKIRGASFQADFKRGNSWIIPSTVGAYQIQGSAKIYKASSSLKLTCKV